MFCFFLFSRHQLVNHQKYTWPFYFGVITSSEVSTVRLPLTGNLRPSLISSSSPSISMAYLAMLSPVTLSTCRNKQRQTHNLLRSSPSCSSYNSAHQEYRHNSASICCPLPYSSMKSIFRT